MDLQKCLDVVGSLFLLSVLIEQEEKKTFTKCHTYVNQGIRLLTGTHFSYFGSLKEQKGGKILVLVFCWVSCVTQITQHL